MAWLTQHRSIAHSSGVCRSKINVPAFSGSGEDSRPGGRWLTAHRTFTWQNERERKQALDSYSKSTSLIYEGSTLTTSFHPCHFPKASNPIMWGVSKYSVHSIPHREHLGMGFTVRFLLPGLRIPWEFCIVLMSRLHPRQRRSGSLRVRPSISIVQSSQAGGRTPV